MPAALKLAARRRHAVLPYAGPAGEQARILGVIRSTGVQGVEQTDQSVISEFRMEVGHVNPDARDRNAT